MTYECRGACRERRLPRNVYDGVGGYCRECGVAMRLSGRPRKCPCCGFRLRYRVRTKARRLAQ